MEATGRGKKYYYYYSVANIRLSWLISRSRLTPIVLYYSCSFLCADKMTAVNIMMCFTKK